MVHVGGYKCSTGWILEGALTIVDERTGKKYQVQVSDDGTVKAVDLKKVCRILLLLGLRRELMRQGQVSEL